MKRLHLRDSIVLAGTVAVLLIPLALLGWFIAEKHHWALDQMAELEPRYARLLGLEAQKADIAAALERSQAARAQYVYPIAQEPAQAGNAAQQRIRDIFTAAGLQVSSSQVLPPKQEKKGFDRIPLAVRAEGDLLGLQSALSVLNSQAPLIIVNELDVQVLGGLGNVAPTASPRLAVQFSLSILRERL